MAGGRFLFGTLTLAIVVGNAPGHDLKALASRLTLPAIGGKTTVYLNWGHRMPVDELTEGSTLTRYDVTAPDGTVSPLKAEGLSLHAHAVVLRAPGLHTIAVVRKPGVNTYVLDEKGERQFQRGPKTEHAGKKIDSAAKSFMSGSGLIVVGDRTTTAPKPVGLPLEIVPAEGPAEWTDAKVVRFRVLRDGAPVAGAECQARFSGFLPDEAWAVSGKSDETGTYSFKPTQPGTWVVKANVKRPAPAAVRAEYDDESFTTTLTLEIVK